MSNNSERITAAFDAYQQERAKLLGKEADTDQLWRVIVAADKMVDAMTTW